MKGASHGVIHDELLHCAIFSDAEHFFLFLVEYKAMHHLTNFLILLNMTATPSCIMVEIKYTYIISYA